MKNIFKNFKNKERTFKFLTAAVLAVMIMVIFSFAAIVSAADVTIVENAKAKIDYTDTNKTGTVKINTIGKLDSQKTQVRVEKIDAPDKTYSYEFKADGTVESYPLQYGNGEYKITIIYQPIGSNKAASALKCTITLKLIDENAPFLNPIKLVNYNKDSKVVKKAEELTKNCKTELEKVNAIYKFIIESMTYDNDKAAVVNGTYIPVIDDFINFEKGAGKGICYDYASLFAAMLRSQGIPAKLIMGYMLDRNDPGDSNKAQYHAWNEFYIKGVGWFMINKMKFDGDKNEFGRLDPTVESGVVGKSEKSYNMIIEYIGKSSNYLKSHEF